MQQHNPRPPLGAKMSRSPRGTMHIQIGAFEIEKRGAKRYDFRDPYHAAISMSWPQFALLFLVLYLGINVLFALLYLIAPGCVANARPGSFADVFFFSMETLATVGYGAMSPGTLYGHSVAAAEIISGVAFTAIMTGLTFVRFSRAKAKIMYADHPVVATYNGRPTLMLRIANGRAGMLVDAQAELAVLLAERSREGQSFRRVYDLKLQRARLQMFGLTWTLMHVIDEKSPLHGIDAAQMATMNLRMFVGIKAHDYVLAADVYDAHTYNGTDIAFGMRYADAVSVDANGHAIADLTRLSELELDEGTTFEEAAPAQATA